MTGCSWRLASRSLEILAYDGGFTTARIIEGFYNRKRLHESLDYLVRGISSYGSGTP